MRDADAALGHEVARVLGRPLTAEQLAAFRAYLDLLASWNRVHRLVGSSDRAWMIENVILDSLLFLRVLPPSFGSLLDIGSGAGIPGIPIKIARPAASLTMVESRGKRASFLSAAIRALGLSDARVVQARAETLADSEARFDVVVARCAGAARAILDLGQSLAARPGVVVVSGGPHTIEVPNTRCVRVNNPIAGRPRTLLVRTFE